MKSQLSLIAAALGVALGTMVCTSCKAGNIGGTFGSGPVQIDLTSVDATYNATSLTVSMSFSNAIAPPDLGVPNSVGGYIDFDTDQNPNTGAEAFRNLFGVGPYCLLGDEYYADLFSEASHPGFVDILNAVTVLPTGTAPIIYGTNDLSVTIPLSLLGGSDGLLNYAVIVGTFEEATSEAPDGAIPLTSTPAGVPEPSSLILSLTSLFMVILMATRMRYRVERAEFKGVTANS